MNMLKIFYFKQGVFRWFSPLSLSKSSLTSFTLLPALFLSVGLSPWQVNILKEMSVYVNTRSIPFASLQKQSEFRPHFFQLNFLFLPRLSLALCQLVPPCREKLCYIGNLLTFKLLSLSFSSPSFIGFELIFLGWSDVQRSWSRLFLCPLFPHPS